MDDERPTSVTVIAVLNIILGGLGVLGSLCCGLGFIIVDLGFGGAPLPNNTDLSLLALREYWLSLKGQIPWFTMYLVITLILSLILNVLLILSAIGLLALEQWGRWMTIILAGVIIATQLIEAVLAVGLINPAAERATDHMAEFVLQRHRQVVGSPLGGAPVFNSLANVSLAFFFVAYAAFSMVILLLPSVAYRFGGEGRWAPRRPRRREEDRPRRRRDDDDERPRYDHERMDDDPSLY